VPFDTLTSWHTAGMLISRSAATWLAAAISLAVIVEVLMLMVRSGLGLAAARSGRTDRLLVCCLLSGVPVAKNAC
jgi:hypothetical protein